MASGTDTETRQRLAAWTRYLMVKHRIASHAAMAKRMGVSAPAVTQVLSGARAPGLDFLVKLHRAFYESADVLLDTDPPALAGGERDHPHRRSSAAS